MVHLDITVYDKREKLCSENTVILRARFPLRFTTKGYLKMQPSKALKQVAQLVYNGHFADIRITL